MPPKRMGSGWVMQRMVEQSSNFLLSAFHDIQLVVLLGNESFLEDECTQPVVLLFIVLDLLPIIQLKLEAKVKAEAEAETDDR